MRFLYSAGILVGMAFFTAVTALAQAPAARVVVSNVIEKKLAPTREMIGIVDFDKQAGLSAEISGLIAHDAIVEGGLVKKGDLMIRLNTDFIKKDLKILFASISASDGKFLIEKSLISFL